MTNKNKLTNDEKREIILKWARKIKEKNLPRHHMSIPYSIIKNKILKENNGTR